MMERVIGGVWEALEVLLEENKRLYGTSVPS